MRDRWIRDLVRGEHARVAGRVDPSGRLVDPTGRLRLGGSTGEVAPGDLVVLEGRLGGDETFSIERVVRRVRPVRAPHGDPDWRRLSSPALRRALELRDGVERAVGDALRSKGFLQVSTGLRTDEPGQEPTLESLATSDGRWLVTSPELRMKRLVAAGHERIFQLSSVFRGGPGERGRFHHPEFRLLEWYRAFADLEELLEDCEEVVAAAAEAAQVRVLRKGSVACAVERPFERLSVADAFARYGDVDLEPFLDGRDDAFVAGARSAGVRVDEGDDAETVFFRVLLERVEPKLGTARPTFLVEWPARFAALARLDPEDPRRARRVELFAAGVELGNGFDELTDPEEQARRFRLDRERKRRAGGDPGPWPARFLCALESGLPPTVGMALGIDRLLVLLGGFERIDDVLAFPDDEMGEV